jgi:hypothetical protein
MQVVATVELGGKDTDPTHFGATWFRLPSEEITIWDLSRNVKKLWPRA